MTRANVDDEPWRQRAACAELDSETWFPPKGGDKGALAKRICRHCPVQFECLQFALKIGTPDGVWGGLSPDQRAKIRRAQPAYST